MNTNLIEMGFLPVSTAADCSELAQVSHLCEGGSVITITKEIKSKFASDLELTRELFALVFASSTTLL
jgi:hypothetical protein